MPFDSPIVLDGISLPGLVQYILDNHESPSLMVVCGTKIAFLEQLETACSNVVDREPDPGTSPQTEGDSAHRWNDPTMSYARPLLEASTLGLLSKSRNVKLIFCPDITHLRALLARQALTLQEPKSLTEGKRMLAILNPLQLHRNTSEFSVQGVNRTLSVAVEAANHTTSQLVLAECTAETSTANMVADASYEVGEQPTLPAVQASIWDEEVSMLNVSTKSFGAGERGWVGRTVKLRTIAERWCIFKDNRNISSHNT